MQSNWSACPQDVIKQCMNAQWDYSDNAAAACTNRLWRDTFRCGDHAIDLTYSPLRPLPAVSYLHQITRTTSVTLRRLPVWQSPRSWLATSARAQQRPKYVAAAVWSDTLSQIPPACSNVTLVNHLFRADASGSSQNFASAPLLSQLTNLRHFSLQ